MTRVERPAPPLFLKLNENIMIEKKQEKRGVKAGSKRGTYKKTKAARKLFSIRISDAERAKLDAMRGDMSASEFIRKRLGL